VKEIKINNGIYIHIPFCRIKCDYCSFYSIPLSDDEVISNYVNALLDEIDRSSGIHQMSGADTIYFGGGTPSILEPRHVEKIIERLRKNFNIKPESEITIEMNPDDLHKQKLDGFTDAGINRIVLGVQSFDKQMRKNIGRRGAVVTAPELDLFFGHGGFTRCIDIMAGLPEQSEPQLLNDLKTVTAYKPEHISLYLLSVDEDTPLGKRFIPDERFDNQQADLWGRAIEFLEDKGYVHYEISNYALPGFESKHNSKYWDFTPYFGFGSGAHSFVNGKRYSNNMTVEDYIKCGEFLYEYDTPSENSRIVEFIMTSIRRMKGFSAEEFAAVTGKPLPETVISKLNLLKNEGLIEINNGRYYLSKNGMYYTDSIIFKLTEQFL